MTTQQSWRCAPCEDSTVCRECTDSWRIASVRCAVCLWPNELRPVDGRFYCPRHRPPRADDGGPLTAADTWADAEVTGLW